MADRTPSGMSVAATAARGGEGSGCKCVGRRATRDISRHAPLTSLQRCPSPARIERVTQPPNGVLPKRTWRARFRRISQLYRLLQTLDVRQLRRLLAEFEDE